MALGRHPLHVQAVADPAAYGLIVLSIARIVLSIARIALSIARIVLSMGRKGGNGGISR
jgi:succinate-acetate transporter protein